MPERVGANLGPSAVMSAVKTAFREIVLWVSK